MKIHREAFKKYMRKYAQPLSQPAQRTTWEGRSRTRGVRRSINHQRYTEKMKIKGYNESIIVNAGGNAGSRRAQKESKENRSMNLCSGNNQ